MKSTQVYKYLVYIIMFIYILITAYNLYHKNYLYALQNVGIFLILYFILKGYIK